MLRWMAAMDSKTRSPGRRTGNASHFVLTRFNVRSFYHTAEPTDEWLHTRLDLFREYCLPCLTHQTSSRFTWLVFVDSLSPKWFLKEIQQLGNGIFETVPIHGHFTSAAVSAEITLRTSTAYILTTRVDNDDAVSKDFIETIQACFTGQEFEFLNLVNGAQYATGKAYLRPYTKNPFLTLVEKITADPPSTVFIEHHYRVNEKGPVRNVRTAHPMWLQIIHGGNILNEVVGLRVPGQRLASHFGCELRFDDNYGRLVLEMSLGFARIFTRLIQKPARIGELLRVLVANKPGRNVS